MTATPSPPPDLDRFVARLLTLGTYLSISILAIGVLLLVAAGQSPLDARVPPFDFGRIPSDIVALRPEGFLWLGLVALLATPATRVLASLVGYLREHDRRMALIAIGILAVIATSVLTAVATGG